MKIQNMAVIFIIIILPITILLSVYVKNEIKVIAKQNEYDQVLNDSTYDAVKAFKLNTVNNGMSTLSDSIRRDLKASINTFFTSLSTNLGVSGYGTDSIKPYIPAIVYTLYDGFYIYSPAYNQENGAYEHIIKPYIYYAMRYQLNSSNSIVVNYTLDNYIVVYGNINGEYISEAGYLENVNDISINGNDIIYKGINITDETAKKYYIKALNFTNWVNENLADIITPDKAIKIGTENEKYPEFSGDSSNKFLKDVNWENESSAFNSHRKEVIRLIIQDNLSAAITSYSNNSEALKTTYNFKMPELKAQEWDRLIENVTMITFMQGLPLGSKYYNGYSMVTCDKNKEYTSEDAIYYIEEGSGYYHRIDCPKITNLDNLEGYANIDFERKIKNNFNLRDKNKEYTYDHDEIACYYCIINSNYEGVDVNLDEKRLQAKYNAVRKN